MRALPLLAVCIALTAWTGTLQAADGNESPVLIRADELRYDRKSGDFSASGAVEIHQGDRVLRAERMEYDPATGKVVAEGNIVLHEPGGQVVFARRMELEEGLANGVVEGIRMLFADEGRLVADQARRVDSGTFLRRAAYSRCRRCEDSSESPLLWRLVAGEVFQDAEGQEVVYRNLVLEVWGLPIFYLPYFWHPGPEVGRKSGFLVPEASFNRDLGVRIEFPYHYVIDESRDLTITPIYLAKENPLTLIEYRQRFDRGVLRFNGSATRSGHLRGNIDDPEFRSGRWRGHVMTSGKYHIDRFWRAGFDYNRASDRTYLKRYGLIESERRLLRSRAFAERFEGRNHFLVAGHAFQDLRSDAIEDQPYIAPLIGYNYVGEGGAFGGRPSFDIDSRYLYRRDGTRNLRASMRPGYRVSQDWAPGFVTAAEATLQLDAFSVKARDAQNIRHRDKLRATPRLAVDWRMPFVRAAESRQDSIEPVALVVLAPDRKNPDALLDEESSGFDTDDTNLFSHDRFPGFDRVEDGQRFAYGVNVGTQGATRGVGHAFLGQSYRLGSDPGAGGAPGIASRFSDYVGRIGLQLGENLDVLYRFKFSRNDFAALRHAASFSVGPPSLRFSGDYLKVQRDPTILDSEEREEIKVALEGRLARFWTGGISTRVKLDDEDKGSLERALALQYEDECFAFSMRIKQTFTRDVEVEPQTRFLFKVLLKFPGIE